ncbi:HlyD family efflux transporter periplasmic adaptor subunit [Actinoplanes couchii]|uniref:Peptidoglycan-binding protein n=1 Tax=Actinoplanes couchii TaxID=403638 RepID=A0ABQ3X1Z4_9ACTN|nr:HlyD family efflux transporter periplasmic adaptor subunit [Actinoplanes couchii]MDR6316941.1 hypothetical protein [Actinoplanes couchii]GID52549.1 peptidoglycan-binding protein [Actinoplanes couchii]
MGRQTIFVAALALAGALGGCTAGDGAGAGPGPSGPAVATAAIERTDLSTAQTLAGTLGYGAPRTIRAAGGTVTWLPKIGTTVKRGQPLYRNDDHPVLLLYGATPLFRPLQGIGTTGRDVRVVVDNLRALGYHTGDQPRRIRPGDAVLTRTVIEAIKSWQRDAGRPETGVLAAAEVVVLPGAVRVDRVAAQLGDPAADGVLTVTGRRKAVTVPVRAGDLNAIRTGLPVQVELPGGDTAKGRVTAVGRDATATEGDSGADVAVTVGLSDPAAVGDLDSAPVRVTFTGEVREDVLAVPVAALLALREGGHAVQLAGGPLVAVETGMFAMGMVEISGDGLAEGARVVTAS